MESNDFWNMLSVSSKAKVEEIFQNYVGSEGHVGRIFELYEEGASALGMTIEEYLDEVSPNEYVDYFYEKHMDIQFYKTFLD